MSVNIDLSNKKGIVFGLANQRSIAWSISEKLMDAGATLAFTYLDERLLKSINGLLEGKAGQGFNLAMETSSYSLVTIAREASKYFSESGGSVISMTFDASTRVYPGYNVMGTAKAALENINRQLSAEFGPRQIRFNSISAGPLPSLSARSIPGFVQMRKAHEERSPIKRPITHEEVANTALFLISDLSSGITGSVIPVDGGYGIIAL